ncbi:Bgt-1834 [Blumeria graminis f. sp. tritici]|uniref:glutathione-specific gamma-glutamylcyclotransferase n=2 Tax=Blumeria graminis f. sp. tritici TaxID=62690 RepID=A0A061HI70_BLUGR|nr:hypothetical protein BGT96224_1834 [Blumeria graminis f. sp. tritici 96224]VDB90736.1 Bgt-1834 [Blumeria graminis f. sp. tritici]
MGDTVNGRSEEFWIFGYGSLIWKPPPFFDRRIHGYVTGYVRRFWQPGFVVTLIERSFWESLEDPEMSASHRVLGTAYRIEPANVAHVRAYLDLRETNGYTLHETTFHPAHGSPDIRVFVYIGTPDNPQFCGPQDPQFLAERIYSSSGQSGLNRNYLYSLESALLDMNSEEADYHVANLADRVRKLALLCSRECMG